MRISDGKISKQVYNAMSKFFDEVEFRREQSEYDARYGKHYKTDDLVWPGRGLVDKFREDYYTGGTVKLGDRQIIILAFEITHKPEIGDVVIAAEKRYKILSIDQDPAKATYVLHGTPDTDPENIW